MGEEIRSFYHPSSIVYRLSAISNRLPQSELFQRAPPVWELFKTDCFGEHAAQARVARARGGSLERVHPHAFNHSRLASGGVDRLARKLFEACPVARIDDVINSRQIEFGQLPQASRQIGGVSRRAPRVADGLQMFIPRGQFDDAA